MKTYGLVCSEEMSKTLIKKKKEDQTTMEKGDLFAREKRVNYLYFEENKDYSKREIARMEDVSTNFVVNRRSYLIRTLLLTIGV